MSIAWAQGLHICCVNSSIKVNQNLSKYPVRLKDYGKETKGLHFHAFQRNELSSVETAKAVYRHVFGCSSCMYILYYSCLHSTLWLAPTRKSLRGIRIRKIIDLTLGPVALICFDVFVVGVCYCCCCVKGLSRLSGLSLTDCRWLPLNGCALQ